MIARQPRTPGSSSTNRRDSLPSSLKRTRRSNFRPRASRILIDAELPGEVMAPMAGRRPRLDVAAGILQVAHATIADVAQEIRIVEQLENERRIGVRQWAQSQSRGLGEHALPMLVDAGLPRKRGGAASTPSL